MLRVTGRMLAVLGVTAVAACAANLLHAPEPRHARAADGAEGARFDPDVVRPRPGSALESALRARAAGDRETARNLASAALPSAPPAEEPLLRWIAAQSARSADAIDEAAALLFPLALSDHPLASWAKLSSAEWLEARDPGRALAMLDVLLVPSSELESWPGKQTAERLRARVLGKIGRREDAIRSFEQLLRDSGDETGAIQVLMPLCELLAGGDGAEQLRALELCTKVMSRAPDSRAAHRAEELVRNLRITLPPELVQSIGPQLSLEALARAEQLLSRLRFKEALSAFSALEPEFALDPALLCRVRFGRAKALLDNKARTEGAELMAEVARECAYDAEQRAWARYQAGRALAALGRNEQAIEQYEALEREAPEHRLADDALFRAAKVAREMGDEEGALARLEALPKRYPNGDMQVRARFTMALLAGGRGDFAGAARLLSEDKRDEAGEDVQGRAGYFHGRFLAQAGRLREAADAYADTVRRVPLSYYGMAALARLSDLDRERAQALAPKLSPRAEEQSLSFAQRPALARPGFKRALALMAAGEPQLAMSELRSLGFCDSTSDPELTWIAAALLDRAGAPHLSLELARKRMADLLARAPVGRTLALYRLVYPYAFSPLIEDSALRERVPPAFVRAVAREESGFYPKAVSRSGAHGLIQLLQSTAKAISKGGLRLPTHPAALQEPAINLALGTHFIATLHASVRGQIALVPAAYNAGPAATQRWLKARSSEALDVWIENIPYDETRTYSRRVLQTYGIYNWLETGKVLQLPERLLADPEPPLVETQLAEREPAAEASAFAREPAAEPNEISPRPTLRAGL
jgi:soluble lytic murein transglycosylase